MNEPVEDVKIIGIPKSKFLKLTYTLLIISAVFGVLASSLGLFDMGGVISGVATVSGIAGLVLVFFGFYAFSEQFSDLEIAHFKYMGVVILGFIILAIALAVVFGKIAIIFNIVVIMLNVAALAFMYVGFKLFERGSEATKDTVIDELKFIKSQIQNSNKKNTE